jgi:hypothetical protein
MTQGNSSVEVGEADRRLSHAATSRATEVQHRDQPRRLAAMVEHDGEIAALTERLVASPAPDTDSLAMAIDVISEKGDDGVRRHYVAALKSRARCICPSGGVRKGGTWSIWRRI